MADMNWVDYLLLIIIGLSVLVGFKRGLVREMISLASIIVAFVVAGMFAETLAKTFMTYPSVQSLITRASDFLGIDTTQPVSYFALLMSYASLFVVTIIAGNIISQVLNLGFGAGVFGIGNHLLGGAFGLCRGAIIVLIVIYLMQLTPLGKQSWWMRSQIVIAYQPTVQLLASFVSPTLAKIEEKTKIGETIKDTGSQLQQMIQ